MSPLAIADARLPEHGTFVGHAILSTLEGVRLGDWANAWRVYRGREVDINGHRYSEMPNVVKGESFVGNEIGGRRSQGLIPAENVRQVWGEGGSTTEKIGNARAYAGEKLRRIHKVVDEFGRTAVYFKTVRTTGDVELALQRAHAAAIDYGDLSPGSATPSTRS